MDSSFATYALVALSALYFGYTLLGRCRLSHIPTVGGPSSPILSYYGAFNYLFHAADIMRVGYAKHKSGIFKYAEPTTWRVIVTGPKLVDELRKAPDNELSFPESIRENLLIDYTLGPNVHHDPYHLNVIGSTLTRNLPALFPIMRDEIIAAFDDGVPGTAEGQWTKVRAYDAMTQIVCRASNRLFVGLPICRDQDYCDLNKTFTVDVVMGATTIGVFPNILKLLVARWFTNVPKSIRHGIKHLGPTIAERLRMLEERGEDWTDRPNDLIQWLIQAAKGEERSIRNLVLRVLTINVGAIHTSSMAFTHALYHLAANPEYIRPLREEVDTIVQKDGWTKTAIDKMHKVDSFLKEVQRLNGLGTYAMARKAMKDFTFSDGTFIPAGTDLAVPSLAIHLDEEMYPNATVFDPWRFSKMHEKDGEPMKHHMASTSTEYLTFAHGRRACPGRFFAALELKAMLAHLVATYDVRMEKEGVIPPAVWFGRSYIPDMKAEVMFRRRQM